MTGEDAMKTEVILGREKLAEFLARSVQEVMESMAFMELAPEEFYVPEGGMVRGEVVATLGFTGENSGLVVASLKQDLARRITANMLGMEVQDLEDPMDVGDAVGEVVNMVAGNVKNQLVAEGWSMELSVPVVNSGREVEVKLSPDLRWGVGRVFVNEEGERFLWELRFRGKG